MGDTLKVNVKQGGRVVAREAILLAAREVLVLVVVVAVLAWVGFQVFRQQRR
jgi:hypothetical protein